MARDVYEALNEQLTTEIPQLIDLRVPYLDPSFEALVKIQLRCLCTYDLAVVRTYYWRDMIVCAEAYSRMAQVQQYLDPNTREQYAQGHLDQRVEQVLQEIRDLSIAGAS
jgi:amphiphysin